MPSLKSSRRAMILSIILAFLVLISYPIEADATESVIIDHASFCNEAGLSILDVSIRGDYGWSCAYTDTSTYTALAEPFTLNESKHLTKVDFFAYQTYSTTTSPFQEIYVTIFVENPGPVENRVWGDFTTNRLESTAFTECYRVLNTDLENKDRPIMRVTANIDQTLPAGDYWIAFSAKGGGGSIYGGPNVDPAPEETMGAMQRDTSGNWYIVKDGISEEAMNFPLRIYGTDVNTPPVVEDQSFTVTEGDEYHGQVTGEDAEGDSLVYNLVSGPSEGSITFNGDGSFTYRAPSLPLGLDIVMDSFQYHAADLTENSLPATVTISVKKRVIPVQGITIDKDQLELTLDGGPAATLKAVIEPENATNPNIFWRSSDEEVASVEDGIVTPLSPGTTTITATTEDGGYVAECEIRVKTPIKETEPEEVEELEEVDEIEEIHGSEVTEQPNKNQASEKELPKTGSGGIAAWAYYLAGSALMTLGIKMRHKK